MNNDSNLTRRSLFKSAAAGGIGASLLNLGSPASAADDAGKKLAKGSVVLFQGDSITDARRGRKEEAVPNNSRQLGGGYPHHIGAYLLQAHPALELKIHNRGISGNKVPDLDARWQKDCLDLKPAVLSILVGVNDLWHKMSGRYDGTVETYETGFAALLKRTKEALPDTKIVICEPFALRCGAVKDDWFPEFDQRRAAAKKVAEAAGTTWVPFQKMFDDAIAAGTKPEYWARDGVHPTVAGHGLMARQWVETVAKG